MPAARRRWRRRGMGARTLLLTHRLETIGEMSCNPAIGGLGKGHLVREIDALGGVDGAARSTAPASSSACSTAARARRCAARARRPTASSTRRRCAALLAEQPNLDDASSGEADDLRARRHGASPACVDADRRADLRPAPVVLTTGTFLGGVIHVGEEQLAGRPGRRRGRRSGSRASLARLGLRARPPEDRHAAAPRRPHDRLHEPRRAARRRPEPVPFSFLTDARSPRRRSPATSPHTTRRTHEIIRANLASLADVRGRRSQGVGPRYCPSIEDKVVRFADRERHQIFLEPEGLDDDTSLPERHLDLAAARRAGGDARASIPGLETRRDAAARLRDRVRLRRPARARRRRSRRKAVAGPVLRRPDQRHHRLRGGGGAGPDRRHQRRASAAAGAAPIVLDRAEAYIGVLIDDLVTRGRQRALPHVHLARRVPPAPARRQRRPAADRRSGWRVGCVGAARAAAFRAKATALRRARRRARASCALTPAGAAHAHGLAVNAGRRRARAARAAGLSRHRLARLAADLAGARRACRPRLPSSSRSTRAMRGYLDRQDARHRRLPPRRGAAAAGGPRLRRRRRPVDREFAASSAPARPATLGAAARIPGVTPAALAALLAACPQAPRPRERDVTAARPLTARRARADGVSRETLERLDGLCRAADATGTRAHQPGRAERRWPICGAGTSSIRRSLLR